MNTTLADRFSRLHSIRNSKLVRARYCAALTIPSLLPPEGWTEEQMLPQPFSSVGSRGVTALASRMLSALMPVNDTPFFKFNLKSGVDPSVEIKSYLETLCYQVYRKLISTNLRETVYQAIQSLIVVGDSLIHIEDDYKFRTTRLDHYVVQRAVDGSVQEIIFIEYSLKDEDKISYQVFGVEKEGYEKQFCQFRRNEDNTWDYRKENADGDLLAEGIYEVCPVSVLRWYGVAGENYGRSHCEDTLGDLQSLDSYTKAMLDGMAASTAFWMCLDPSGITEIDDIASQSNGSWVPARREDVFVLSPSQTMNTQISAAQTAVEVMRREIGQAFLMSASAIPSGDRVTATAVRLIGSELETILGGAFSAIARDLLEPIIKRSIFLMIEDESLDKRMYDQFFNKDGTLNIEVVTGLQALSRDTDLQKLMQMGEMVRNLPESALASFKWSEYARALISSLGFDSRNWVISDEEKQQLEQQKMMQQQMMQQQQTAQSVLADAGRAAALQDIQNTGGQGLSNVLQNSGVDMSAFQGG
jgi:hypothetical protein